MPYISILKYVILTLINVYYFYFFEKNACKMFLICFRIFITSVLCRVIIHGRCYCSEAAAKHAARTHSLQRIPQPQRPSIKPSVNRTA